jgi:hypothetical protein
MLAKLEDREQMGQHKIPKPEDICYYKSFKSRVPDQEFDERCLACDGYPAAGCSKYTTKEHVEEFNRKYGIINLNEPRKPIPTGLDDLEQFGGFFP